MAPTYFSDATIDPYALCLAFINTYSSYFEAFLVNLVQELNFLEVYANWNCKTKNIL